jgi:hypothetical protein
MPWSVILSVCAPRLTCDLQGCDSDGEEHARHHGQRSNRLLHGWGTRDAIGGLHGW